MDRPWLLFCGIRVAELICSVCQGRLWSGLLLSPFDTWWPHLWRFVLEIGLPLVCCCCPGLGRDRGFQRGQAFLALALPVYTGSVQSTPGTSPGLLRIGNQSLFSGSLSHSNTCPRVGGGPPFPCCCTPSRLRVCLLEGTAQSTFTSCLDLP